ncbi:hypothetical protein PLESTB_001649300 [Pleodorina starrii]|uniref:Uncharacterized protein n=1 Tax=Pleodorina starrii TaxID=330485 RepID=A0A9W6BZH0_9CHLO|nr:hypothetical protein PLESTM_000871700 [Pleodorina starrii]GLC60625.1 hypothetical protein PLESTB_001649300 [Pleodorina starrii]GLC68885.1 hypothetical protein PLESTF_000754100 [Pleodorina starrii]
MLTTQRPHRAQSWAAEPVCSARPLGWRCPPQRLASVRAGPLDSAPGSETSSPNTTTTTTTTTTEPSAASAGSGPSKDAILARIARAKRYKEPSSSASPNAAGTPGEQATPPGSLPPSPGEAAAPAAAAPRAAALPRIAPTKIDWGAVVGFLDAPVTTERSGGGAPASYGGTAPTPSPADAAAEAAAAAERQRRFMASPEGKDYMEMLLNSPRRDGTGSATRAADVLAGVLAEVSYDSPDGSGAINPELRMEEFTAEKEARLRALGGEVITADPSYNPGGNVAVRVSMGEGAGQMAGPEAAAEAEARRAEAEAARRAEEEAAAAAAAAAAEAAARAEEEARAAAAAGGEGSAAVGEEAAAAGTADGEVYKPKVSTWGMFPRPKDISEAYGGGRNLKPGQALETPQQRAERERSYAAALAAYKTRAGLEVDPEEEERAAGLYEEGMVLFNAGQLKPAYDKFEKVLAVVPVKTKYGGLATLQKAIVLDSVGQSDAAQKLYKSIANHGVAQVSKKAKQMLFSFEAMTFMKADQFSYSVKKSDYAKYFRAPADRRTLYVATEEERQRDEEAMRVAGLVAAAVVLTPVLAVAALAVQR